MTKGPEIHWKEVTPTPEERRSMKAFEIISNAGEVAGREGVIDLAGAIEAIKEGYLEGVIARSDRAPGDPGNYNTHE
jgi:hypothetical protein